MQAKSEKLKLCPLNDDGDEDHDYDGQDDNHITTQHNTNLMIFPSLS